MNVNENRDYTVIVDCSGSMSTEDGGVRRNLSRWKAAEEGTCAAAREVAKLDPDGITVYDFSDSFHRYENQTPDKVAQIFTTRKPGGSTELGAVLNDALNGPQGYLTRKRAGQTKSGETVLIVTDGEPNNQAEVATVIRNATQKLETQQELSLIFVQVGHDNRATAFLRQLDTSLSGAKFDIVSVVTSEDLGTRDLGEVLASAVLEGNVSPSAPAQSNGQAMA